MTFNDQLVQVFHAWGFLVFFHCKICAGGSHAGRSVCTRPCAFGPNVKILKLEMQEKTKVDNNPDSFVKKKNTNKTTSNKGEPNVTCERALADGNWPSRRVATNSHASDWLKVLTAAARQTERIEGRGSRRLHLRDLRESRCCECHRVWHGW